MSDPAIDQVTFDELTATTGTEFAMELVDTFLEEAPMMLKELQSALMAGDADTFRRAAHSLKSNCNTFGALVLGTEARRLELGGLAGATAEGAIPLAALNTEYARVAAALAVLRHA